MVAKGKKESTLYLTHAKLTNGMLNAIDDDSITK